MKGHNKRGLYNHLLKYGILYLLIILLVATHLINGKVLTGSNLINVIRQASLLIMISIGMGVVIITGGIDLSVGSICAYCGVLCSGAIVRWGWSIGASILFAIVLSTIFGMINGFIIAKLGIQPMIASLAMMNAVRGLAYLYTNGGQIVGLPNTFLKIGRGYFFNVIPIPVVIMVVMVLISFFLLTKTIYGKYLYAIGGSEEIAKLAGINVQFVKIVAYTICGFCSAIAGIVYCARLSMGDPTMGDSFGMDAIASVVLGGISLSGGSGSILGAIIGALFITVLANCMNIVGISSYWQLVFKAVVLIVAALIYTGDKQ